MMKIARAIRAWIQRLFSTQDYDERLDTQEGARPQTAKRGRVRWFG